ncbi:MAG: histidine phosphatase family protein [Anaerolineae bacterium]
MSESERDWLTHLILVRHAESDANRLGLWQGGNVDGTLTPLGHLQAARVAERLAEWKPPVQRLYSSPLRRAVQTAEPIAQRLGLDLIFHPDLREIGVGQVSGLTTEEFAQRFPDFYERWLNKDDLDFTWPGGEQRRAFFQRVSRAIGEILALHQGETVVLVTHAGAIRAAVAGLLGPRGAPWWSYKVGNASITYLTVTPAGEADLVLLGDTVHLDPLQEEADR